MNIININNNNNKFPISKQAPDKDKGKKRKKYAIQLTGRIIACSDMAATSTDAIMLEFEKEGLEWVRSEQFLKKKKAEEKERQQNNPMKQCVLKYDHFENIHR